MANFCHNCGESLQGAVRFCPSCGIELQVSFASGSSVPQQVQNGLQHIQEQPVTQQQSFSYAEPKNEGRFNGNLYSHRQSGVSEKTSTLQEIKEAFFCYEGRLNRAPFFWRKLILFAVGVIGAPVVIPALVALVSAIMLTVRRLHDLNRPDWWAVGMFIPVVNFVLELYLFFAEGTRGPNRYGPDPLEGQH